ncbi:hypothetical protein EDC01DRAFT_748080 [Geopyxis carbonaria]|nr:hypothetical protein EDC01DRAFT_748080 [Geopyxis carbonaria]
MTPAGINYQEDAEDARRGTLLHPAPGARRRLCPVCAGVWSAHGFALHRTPACFTCFAATHRTPPLRTLARSHAQIRKAPSGCSGIDAAAILHVFASSHSHSHTPNAPTPIPSSIPSSQPWHPSCLASPNPSPSLISSIPRSSHPPSHPPSPSPAAPPAVTTRATNSAVCCAVRFRARGHPGDPTHMCRECAFRATRAGVWLE